MATDLIGHDLTPAEVALLRAYHDLRALAERDDLPPCAAANVKQALAACFQAVNDLALDFEHLLDVGV
jgi:hypothetical protein